MLKWLAGAIGWVTLGPIAGLLGFIFGGLADTLVGTGNDEYKGEKQFRRNSKEGDYITSMLILSASVMKADGRLLKSELNYIKAHFVSQYGEKATAEYMKALKNLLEQDYSVRQVCQQIRYFMAYEGRIQLMHYLYGIAKADGNVDRSESDILRRIASYLGIGLRQFESIKAMYGDTSGYNYNNSRRTTQTRRKFSDPYKVLGIDKNVDDSAVKKAYRSMARKYHPDKVRHLGEAQAEQAKEKFIKVDEAYNEIKKRRGMK